MAEKHHELDFATLAIAHKIVTREQIETAQEAIAAAEANSEKQQTLEAHLLDTGVISQDEIWAVEKVRERLSRDAQTVRKRIGGYELLGTIGEGGLGVVYRARQLSMGRVVALKVLHAKWVDDDEFRKRFLVEARLVGRLSHQNLIQVFDVGRFRDTLYYSMEYVDGETVEEMIESHGALESLHAVDIIIQIARALQYLNKNKLVHRDVKPGNIMVTTAGVARLGDFGFVKSSLDSVISTEGEVLGTPDYISPEAALGQKDLDWRSDLYSLGVTYYHMLTGTTPFRGSGSSVMEAHIKADIPKLAATSSTIPQLSQRVITMMTEKKPADRYQSFAEIFADLEELRMNASLSDKDSGGGNSVTRVLGGGGGRVEEIVASERRLQRKVKLLLFALAATSVALLGALLKIFFL